MSSVSAADRLIKKKEDVFIKGQGDLWDVVDEVIKVWLELRPTEYQSSVIDIRETRETLSDPVFGTVSKRKTKGTGDLRRTLDVPVFIELTLRRLFTADELPYDRAWYEQLWRRYPMFRVSEKV